jgi:hypothetical protein
MHNQNCSGFIWAARGSQPPKTGLGNSVNGCPALASCQFRPRHGYRNMWSEKAEEQIECAVKVEARCPDSNTILPGGILRPCGSAHTQAPSLRMQLAIERYAPREVFYDMSSEAPLSEHVTALFNLLILDATPTDSAARPLGSEHEVALWIPTHSRFLTAVEWEEGVPQRMSWVVDGCTLQLRVTPALHAYEVLQSLTEGSEQEAKTAVFRLRTLLTEMHFGEEFIEQGGVPVLLLVAEEAGKPALQTYALEVSRVSLWVHKLERRAAVFEECACGGTCVLSAIADMWVSGGGESKVSGWVLALGVRLGE